MKALELIASSLLTASLIGFCMLGEPVWWVAALATALGIRARHWVAWCGGKDGMSVGGDGGAHPCGLRRKPGKVAKELRALGHEAYSCDIEACSGGHPEWHIMADVLPLLNGFCFFFIRGM